MSIQQENFDLQKHISAGIEKIVSDVLKSTLKNPKESAFVLKFAASSRRAAKMREIEEKKGNHVPGFLIASVTSRCNLHCAGCYSRCINTTTDETPVNQLTGDEWKKVFEEASELGISFIIVAGGEPLLRRDIITAAGTIRDVMFPIFTNGTVIGETYLDLFDRCRNLVPVLSIEGNRDTTDDRRGKGIYSILMKTMDEFQKRNLIYGASITVTTENMEEVMSPEFIKTLTDKGCKVVFFIEFVPVTDDARHLAPGDPEREYMAEAVMKLRTDNPDLLLLSFPGDELAMGGCMAGGREFFHVNSNGGAEPCPFSPFSDINVKATSLREAINSPLFVALRESGMLQEHHDGGCVLYEKRDQVAALLQGN